jgi:hypothetical protein
MGIVERDRKREELRGEGGSGRHLASGGDDEARVSAEIVLERRRRGGGRNGSVLAGWAACGLNRTEEGRNGVGG